MPRSQSVKFKGLMASPGKASGRAVVIQSGSFAYTGRPIGASEVASEIARFDRAVVLAASELKGVESRVRARLGEEQAAIFAAQQMMLEDPILRRSALGQIEGNLVSAERACILACEQQALTLRQLDDPYLSERAADLRDIAQVLVRCLGVAARGETAVQHEQQAEPTADQIVIVASDLTPSDTAMLDASRVSAIVLDRGGVTSHTAILAKSLGIPAVIATQSATSAIRASDLVLVDADAGVVEARPSATKARVFQRAVDRVRRERQQLDALRTLPAVTRDGHRIEIAGNIGDSGESDLIKSAGGDGVGLFRTEFLFLNRKYAPDEDEQCEAYRRVLAGLNPMPVVIRTLDIGGDKVIPYLSQELDQDPSTGLRAIQLCFKHRGLFREQLRALLRASVAGNLRIMFPMISNVAELREARAELEAARRELLAEGVPVSDHVQVGIMVEVPSAALDADILARECDFFSIGTNDLVQYTLASDRYDSATAHVSTPFDPKVLRLIARTIDEAHKRGIWVGMCGEMASEPLATALLLGMGIDELSMAPEAIPRVKRAIRGTTAQSAKQLWEHAKTLPNQGEILHFLSEMSGKE